MRGSSNIPDGRGELEKVFPVEKKTETDASESEQILPQTCRMYGLFLSRFLFLPWKSPGKKSSGIFAPLNVRRPTTSAIPAETISAALSPQFFEDVPYRVFFDGRWVPVPV